MPTKLFFSLGKEKQSRITKAAIKEFACNSYINASTNRIVKECGISKGSLFQYFADKEDLYFYILDTVMGEMMYDMASETSALSSDLFQRIAEYSALEISWYISHPDKGRLLIGAAAEKDSEISCRIAERYGVESENIYYEQLKGIEGENLRQDREKIADILKWVMEGFNKSILEKADVYKDSIEQLKEEYTQKLAGYMEILKNGFTERND